MSLENTLNCSSSFEAEFILLYSIVESSCAHFLAGLPPLAENASNSSEDSDDAAEIEELCRIRDELTKANRDLERKNEALNSSIHDEREAVVEARVRLRCMIYKCQHENALTTTPSVSLAPA